MFPINKPSRVPFNPRSQKTKEVFKLTNLCYISIKVEPCESQTGFMQCHNCQQFGYVEQTASNCLWSEDGLLQSECPEKGKEHSTRTCCNCNLAEGEKPHPSNYKGCSHAKEMRHRKIPRALKTNTGRDFASKYNMQGVSFGGP
jgi:hypothetical protein